MAAPAAHGDRLPEPGAGEGPARDPGAPAAPPPDLGRIDVRYAARLAHLELTEEEARRFQSELDAVLAHMAHLREAAAEGVAPADPPAAGPGRLREDQPRAGSLPRDRVLAAAPAVAADGLFQVPPVREGDAR